ncbi:MAG: fatty acid desaturase [Nitrospiraceae bacterium]|nr:MAG: fatty acid desaturase [Nitrospiraceae bacterium]
MLAEKGSAEIHGNKPDWYQATSRYETPDPRKATWQILDTFIPYIALWAGMIYTVAYGYSYWITFALILAASVLLVRIFIFFHDCCHGSFFASSRSNRILGYVSGILTFTPYEDWRRSHAIHHATVGDLDRRGTGDVSLLTVDEYLASSGRTRLAYRLYRNPLVMFGFGPALMFLFRFRLPSKGARKHERRSVLVTNLAIIAVIILASFIIGFKTYLLIQLPVILIAGAIGLWLFYIQHDFEGVYWARHKDWDQMRASLEGCSYYKLPGILKWITGNIGLHHIHHIRPRIPNYNLQKCYEATPALQEIIPLTFCKSLRTPWLNLWDEKQTKLVSFRSVKTQQQGTLQS